MAPKVTVAVAKQPAIKPNTDGDEATAVQEVVDGLRDYAGSTAVAQLVYVALMTLWHVVLPQYLGVRQYMPHATEVLAAEVVLFLLFRAGGGFGSRQLERRWVLYLYSILSAGLLAKCATDLYVYQFAPSRWSHYRPKKPWGIPALLASRLAPRLGLGAEQIQMTIRVLELSTHCFFLLTVFRGILTAKSLFMARRKQKRMGEQKKKT